MRKVSFTINTSLDGYCDHTLFNPDDEVMDYFTRQMEGVGLIFYGRVMYQLMFPYWADVARDQSGSESENRFAEKLVSIDRVVLSATLGESDENTRIIRGNPAEELLKLKRQPGGTISVDTVSMLPELISAGMIDELNLVIHPIIAGSGRMLFPAGSLVEKLNLKLADTLIFHSGCVALHYSVALPRHPEM